MTATCDHCGRPLITGVTLVIHQYGRIFCSYECLDASKAAEMKTLIAVAEPPDRARLLAELRQRLLALLGRKVTER